MNLLDRYIGHAVLWSVVGVLVLIVGLDALFAIIGELDEIEGQYQWDDALHYVALTLPRRCYEFIPVATLIGCLTGLGALANHNELTVMRAAGVSVLRIIRSASVPVLGVIALGMVLGQFVVPNTEQYAESRKTLLLEGSDTLQSRHGFWYREGNEFFHIKAIQPNGVIHGVARYRFDDAQRLRETGFAVRGIFQGDHWILEDVKLTRLEDKTLATEHRATWRWETAITPRLMSIVVLSPVNLSVTDLLQFARYRNEQALESGPYFFAFWQKTLQPLTTLVMVFIAVSFIFGPLRSVTMGQRLITGIMVGLVFNYGQQVLGHISVVYDVPPFLAAALPIVVFMLVGLRLMRRV